MKRDEGMLVVSDWPCPSCGGSDPLSIYQKSNDKGEKYYDGYCFSQCGYLKPEFIEDNFDTSDLQNPRHTVERKMITPEQIEEVMSNDTRGWRERNILKVTSEKYGVMTKMDEDGKVINRYYPCTEDNELVGFHVRDDKIKQARKHDKTIEKPAFFPIGRVKKTAQLFGQSLFPKGGKFLVITTGQEDALAVYQALKTDKYETPVVSPHGGDKTAIGQIRANYEYINSFQKVVLMFDNDKSGKEAEREVTKMFGYGKIVVADLTYKDPCDYLLRPEGAQQLRKAFWESMPKKPSQVLTVSDIYERAMQMPEMGLSFPWPAATKATLGIRRGEVHIVGAAPKIGKTEHQHQLIKHMTDVHGETVGVMSLEENPVKTLKKVAGKYAGKQFTKPPEVGGYTFDEMRDAFALLENKMEFYSSDGVRDYQEILDTVRYWSSKGIWFFIIDPLTALVAEHSSGEANDILNNFMSKAASMAMELQITFFMYSHVNPAKGGLSHDQGGDVLSSQFTGSRAMEKWAHYGWGIQRDRSEKDERKRNTARVTMLFDREFGEYCEYFAFYDKYTNDWSEIELDENGNATLDSEDDDFPIETIEMTAEDF